MVNALTILKLCMPAIVGAAVNIRARCFPASKNRVGFNVLGWK